jgi:hypothetical protein
MVVGGNDDDLEAETRQGAGGNSFKVAMMMSLCFLFDWDPQAIGGLGSLVAIGNFSSGGDRSEQKVPLWVVTCHFAGRLQDCWWR